MCLICSSSQAFLTQELTNKAMKILDEATDGKNTVLTELYSTEIEVLGFDRKVSGSNAVFKIVVQSSSTTVPFACVVVSRKNKTVSLVKAVTASSEETAQAECKK